MKRVKQWSFDIVMNEEQEHLHSNNIIEIETEIENVINKIGEKYKFKVAGVMFQEDVTDKYRQEDL